MITLFLMDNLFMNQIAKNFDTIKKDFQTKIKRMGLAFDEDVFSDTIIKCNNKLTNSSIQYKEMISYFWTAFKINTLRELDYSRNKTTNVFPTNLIYQFEEANNAFEEVSKMIINKFGEDKYQLFILHCNGTPYNELSEMTDVTNLKYIFRRIREYVRKNYRLY